MPIYQYKHPDTEEVFEIFQGMNEEHEYIHDDGVVCKRLFTIPNASFDTQINPFSKSEFLEHTRNKKGTVGDLMDISSEMSERRAAKEGEDPVKRNYFNEYSKSRRGMKHWKDQPKKIEDKNFVVEL